MCSIFGFLFKNFQVYLFEEQELEQKKTKNPQMNFLRLWPFEKLVHIRLTYDLKIFWDDWKSIVKIKK